MRLENRSRLQVWSRLAALIGIMCLLSDFAPAWSQARNHPDASGRGATARQAMIAMFRDRDSTAIDRFFSEPFVQHDPNIGDGLPGLRDFVTELANSPTTNVTIYRTVVDGDIVMLHSKYEGWPSFPGPVITFDLFRFMDGNHYVQHASKVGDGTARMKARVSEVEKPGETPVLIPRRYVADGNFVLCLVEARTEPPTANYDLFRVENGRIAEHWDVRFVIPQ